MAGMPEINRLAEGAGFFTRLLNRAGGLASGVGEFLGAIPVVHALAGVPMIVGESLKTTATALSGAGFWSTVRQAGGGAARTAVTTLLGPFEKMAAWFVTKPLFGKGVTDLAENAARGTVSVVEGAVSKPKALPGVSRVGSVNTAAVGFPGMAQEINYGSQAAIRPAGYWVNQVGGGRAGQVVAAGVLGNPAFANAGQWAERMAASDAVSLNNMNYR